MELHYPSAPQKHEIVFGQVLNARYPFRGVTATHRIGERVGIG